MKRYHARRAVIQAMKEKGLYEGWEDNEMTVAICR
jgi:valyl-tRNA synthetase